MDIVNKLVVKEGLLKSLVKIVEKGINELTVKII